MTTASRHLSPEAARALVQPTHPWLSCDDCFDLMDVYVEALLADPATDQMPAMIVHLHGCGACADEALSMLTLVAGQDGVDPGPATRRLLSRQ